MKITAQTFSSSTSSYYI